MAISDAGSNIVHCVLYRDAERGIEWLEHALGFVPRVVYREPSTNVIVHAELTLGSDAAATGMVMIGTAGHNPRTAAWNKQPDEAGGVTAGAYLMVADCGPVYAQAATAGAEILLPLETMSYGGQAFTVRDPEGHIWSVGEYNPWTVEHSEG